MLARDLGAALACRVELGLEPVHVALQRLLLGVVDFAAHGDADEDADHERDEDGSERCNVVAEVEHGRLQSCSSLAKGVQSGESLAGEWSQALEYCARAGAVDGQGRACHAVGGGLEHELGGEALLDVVPREAPFGSAPVMTTVPSDSGRRSKPIEPPRTTCQRAPSATPRRSGRIDA